MTIRKDVGELEEDGWLNAADVASRNAKKWPELWKKASDALKNIAGSIGLGFLFGKEKSAENNDSTTE